MQKKIIHVITGLNVGGAEMMLYKLLSGMNRESYSSAVVTLTDDGPLTEQIQKIGYPVYSLGIRSGQPNPIKIVKLAQLIRSLEPDLLQGWMYHGNLASQLTNFLLSKQVPVIWN